MHEKMREVKKYSWHYTFNFYQQPSKAFYTDTSHQYPKKEVEIYWILSMDYGNNKTALNKLKYIKYEDIKGSFEISIK